MDQTHHSDRPFSLLSSRISIDFLGFVSFPPADHPGRHTDHLCKFRDVSRYNSSRTDDGSTATSYSGQNDSVHADIRPSADTDRKVTASLILSLFVRRTGLPCAAMERDAASKISTTSRPVMPLEIGDAPL